MTAVTLTAADGGRFDAYVAAPAGGRAPGLVLLQYICGVNRVMRDIADAFAREGYLVAVPDLFWRQQPGVELIPDPSRPTPAEQQRALALNDGFRDEPAVLDMRATLEYLRADPRCNGRVGTLGYCLGGRLAVLLAMRSDVDCAVSYYGVNIDQYLAEVPRIARPLLVHFAEKDALVPAANRERIIAALATRPGVTIEVHEGANHAFALEGGPNFAPAAAARANETSRTFLRRHLGA